MRRRMRRSAGRRCRVSGSCGAGERCGQLHRRGAGDADDAACGEGAGVSAGVSGGDGGGIVSALANADRSATDWKRSGGFAMWGMTRAMDTLVLTRARYRRRYGSDMPEASIASRFLEEVPQHLVEDLSGRADAGDEFGAGTRRAMRSSRIALWPQRSVTDFERDGTTATRTRTRARRAGRTGQPGVGIGG